MKGRTPNAKEKRWHDSLCRVVGCIACRHDGIANHHVSVHHCDGRTKPHAHWFCLPLCAGHHQDGTGAPGLVAVHPYKARFEALYGEQEDLLYECAKIIQESGGDVPNEVWLCLHSFLGQLVDGEHVPS